MAIRWPLAVFLVCIIGCSCLAPDSPGDVWVDVHIRPGSEMNQVNPCAKGVIPVAIISTEGFDATEVVVESVVFAGALVAVNKAGKLQAHVEDLNADGLPDLLIQVDIADLDPLELHEGEGCITALTRSGDVVRGCDEFQVAPGRQDEDGDGMPDCADGCPEDPEKVVAGACGCGVADTDSDGDGTPDCSDGCPSDPAKVEPGLCGCGVADTDSDGDGTPDCSDGCPSDPAKVDPGLCGCGIADTDSDGDGTPDCIDGCPNDPAKVEPGLCGCGVADTDSDGDGTPDCSDGCPDDPSKTEPGVCGCNVPESDLPEPPSQMWTSHPQNKCGYTFNGWSPVDGATYYNLYRAPALEGPYDAVATVSGSWLGYNDWWIPANVYFYYKVRACNECGCGELSTVYRKDYAQGPPDDAPTGVQATDGYSCAGVKVTWDEVTCLTPHVSYNIYRSTSPSNGYTRIGQVPYHDPREYGDQTATPGTTYYYKVAGYTPCGEGPLSSYDEGYRNIVPAAPTNLQASDGTYCDFIRLTWDAVAGASGYLVYWSENGTTWWGPKKVYSTSYDYPAYWGGQTYTFRVRAFSGTDNSCNSGYSNTDTGFRWGPGCQ
ncbi:fibronectin type III domain-containing protein [Candidatus Bipolaricaulota bacterium]